MICERCGRPLSAMNIRFCDACDCLPADEGEIEPLLMLRNDMNASRHRFSQHAATFAHLPNAANWVLLERSMRDLQLDFQNILDYQEREIARGNLSVSMEGIL